MALSPDCQWMAVSFDNYISLRSAGDWRERGRIATPEQARQLVFTLDGQHLIWAPDPFSSSAAAHVVRTRDRVEVVRISNQENPAEAGIYQLFFRPEIDQGRHLYMVLGNTFMESPQPVRVLWREADLLQRACKQLVRNLTAAEWTAYVGQESRRQTCPQLP